MSETRPGQHAGSESQHWERENDGVNGMRVFMVNKNKGWQASRLLHRNAPSSHLHCFFFFFFACVSRRSNPSTHRDNGAVSLWHMWIIRLVTTTVCGSMLKMRCVCLISGKGVFAKEGNLSCLSPAKKKYWSVRCLKGHFTLEIKKTYSFLLPVVLFIHQDFLERRWEVLEIFALELQLSDQYDRTSCH